MRRGKNGGPGGKDGLNGGIRKQQKAYRHTGRRGGGGSGWGDRESRDGIVEKMVSINTHEPPA